MVKYLSASWLQDIRGAIFSSQYWQTTQLLGNCPGGGVATDASHVLDIKPFRTANYCPVWLLFCTCRRLPLNLQASIDLGALILGMMFASHKKGGTR